LTDGSLSTYLICGNLLILYDPSHA